MSTKFKCKTGKKTVKIIKKNHAALINLFGPLRETKKVLIISRQMGAGKSMGSERDLSFAFQLAFGIFWKAPKSTY